MVAVNTKIERCCKDLKTFAAKLDALSPLAVLSRGYSIVTSEEKCIVDARTLEIGEKISVKFSDGRIIAEVKEIEG